MRTLEDPRRMRLIGRSNEPRADLILAGFQDITAQTMLSIAEDIRQALAVMGVAQVSIRVRREEDEDPDFLRGA